MRLVASFHKQIYDQKTPDRFLYETPEETPADYYVCMYVCMYVCSGVPNRNPLHTKGLPTGKTMYDQGGSPQAELRPGRQNYDEGPYVPTSRITTRELAGGQAELRPGNLSCAWLASWLAGRLAGWLAEPHRGPVTALFYPRSAFMGLST